MEKVKILTTIEEIRTFSDPYRLEIISTLHQLRKPATVKQIAVKMGEVPAKVYYHVKKMEKVNLVKIAYTEEINGIIAKYYELTAESFKIEKEQINTELIDEIVKEQKQTCEIIFDKNKKIFLESVENELGNGTLTSTILYLTDQEAEEINEILQKFIKAHLEPKHQGQRAHAIFNSLIRTEKDE